MGWVGMGEMEWRDMWGDGEMGMGGGGSELVGWGIVDWV